jgi:CRP-like cAMP-binding protein
MTAILNASAAANIRNEEGLPWSARAILTKIVYITKPIRRVSFHDRNRLSAKALTQVKFRSIGSKDYRDSYANLRLQAVRALIRLEESGPITQDRLAEQLGIERYAVSRLLSKLELHRYVACERVGSEKVVRLARH